MSKPIDPAKAAAMAEKAATNATKAENKRLAGIIKEQVATRVDAAKEAGAKDLAKNLAALGKDLAAAVKA